MRKKGILMVDLNQMFEAQMQWSYQNGIIDITGRDIVCLITGIFIGIVFILFLIIVEEVEKEIKNGHKKQK